MVAISAHQSHERSCSNISQFAQCLSWEWLNKKENPYRNGLTKMICSILCLALNQILYNIENRLDINCEIYFQFHSDTVHEMK